MDAPGMPPSPQGTFPVPPPSAVPQVQSAAPIAPLPASLPDPEPEAQDLSSLSPAAVLGKHPVAAPGTPVEVHDREELLRQAAQAPDMSLILPLSHPDDILNEPLVLNNKAAGEYKVPVAASLAGIAVQSRAAMPEQKVEAAQSSIQVKPELPAPNLVSMPLLHRQPLAPVVPARPSNPAPELNALQKHAVPAALLSENAQSARPKRSKIGLISLLGLVLILVVGAGSAVLLAFQGSRVPVLFPAVSNISRSGTAQAARSLAVIGTHKSYGYEKGTKIEVGLQAGSTTPSLPSGSGAGTGITVQPISVLKSDLGNGSRIIADDSFAGTLTIAADQGTGVPVELSTGKDASGGLWTVRLPLNTSPAIRTVSSDPIHETLLTTVLQPLSLKTLLNSVKSEQGYSKQTYQGQKVAVYQYVLQPDKVRSLLATGITFDTVKATVSYYWKTGLPVEAVVTGTFKLQSLAYTYKNTAFYGGWDGALPTEVADLPTATDSALLPTADFIAQLGIKPQALPGLDPAIANALPTDLAPIKPTGTTSTTVDVALPTLNPPIPPTEASADAKNRDTQRRHDLADLQTVLERYKTVVGTYPKVAAPFEQTRSSASLLKALVPNYLTAMPVDPINATYWYEYSSDGATYKLRSVAEDASRPEAKLGLLYHYYEVTSK
jgi:hypothetical protein